MDKAMAHWASQIEFVRTRRIPSQDALRQEGTRKSHRHALYEVYRFISGDAEYFIENKMHDLLPGHLFVIRSDEFHNLSTKSPALYEKVAVRFPRELAMELSVFGTDLLACFDNRPRGVDNKVIPDVRASYEIDGILSRMESLFTDEEEASPALRAACLTELLVRVNRAHLTTDRDMSLKPVVSDKLSPVLAYIDENLEGDLSLKTISRQFFLSVSVLCTLFRETTGVGMHEYITFRRVSKARELLLRGASVGEAGTSCGFNDYANFIRTFRKVTGIPPGRYRSQTR